MKLWKAMIIALGILVGVLGLSIVLTHLGWPGVLDKLVKLWEERDWELGVVLMGYLILFYGMCLVGVVFLTNGEEEDKVCSFCKRPLPSE